MALRERDALLFVIGGDSELQSLAYNVEDLVWMDPVRPFGCVWTLSDRTRASGLTHIIRSKLAAIVVGLSNDSAADCSYLTGLRETTDECAKGEVKLVALTDPETSGPPSGQLPIDGIINRVEANAGDVLAQLLRLTGKLR